ncbi:MAG: DUF5806 family protein, partial [Halohasta sp.]
MDDDAATPTADRTADDGDATEESTAKADAVADTEPADEADETADIGEADEATAGTETEPESVPSDVRKYERFTKMDGAQYDRVNEFLRDRTYITAREWAIARLCADFRTETGVEMTKIGENLPRL